MWLILCAMMMENHVSICQNFVEKYIISRLSSSGDGSNLELKCIYVWDLWPNIKQIYISNDRHELW